MLQAQSLAGGVALLWSRGWEGPLGKVTLYPVLAFVHFFLGHLLLATAAHSVPSWMPTSLVKGGPYYILHFCNSLILFILLIPSLWLFP